MRQNSKSPNRLHHAVAYFTDLVSVFRAFRVGGWVISLFVFGLVFPGINNWGHGGGIIGWIILGMVLGYNDNRKESLFDQGLALLCGAIIVGVLGGGGVYGARALILFWNLFDYRKSCNYGLGF